MSSRTTLATFLESSRFQNFIIGVIIVNALILGLETSRDLMASHGGLLKAIDLTCLYIFVAEIALKLWVYRLRFFRDGWNLFDFAVVAIAFIPNAGAWSILRSLRILRILRLITAAPSLKRVVAALLHAIPGLVGVIGLMALFFYTAAVLATSLFGADFPLWFGNLGRSFYTLFQVMTLESWSMGIVRPVMEVHPWAWAFFVPFIVIATFTILNLFLGIIVSTMQELSILPENEPTNDDVIDLLEKIDTDLKTLKKALESKPKP